MSAWNSGRTTRLADRMARLGAWLFPDPPRDFPGRRGVKVGLRALHLCAAALLLGSYAFSAPDSAREAWLLATLGTGCALLALDLHESAAFLLQVRGAVVIGKLACLAALPHLGAAQAPVLGGLMIVSALSSHAPSRVRYRVLFGRGRVCPATTKG